MSVDDPVEFQRQVDELDTTWPVGKTFDLPVNATVVILGAYRGKVITYMLQHYPQIAHIYGFEPQSWAVLEAMEHMRQALTIDQRMKVELHDYGLIANIDSKELSMGEWATDGCSLVTDSVASTGKGQFIPFAKAIMGIMSQHPSWPMETHKIDLLVMNIEGYEWTLLSDMAAVGTYITRPQFGWIDRLCVQFHEHAIKDDVEQFAVMAELAAYYDQPVYDDYPKWVYWKKEA